MAARAPLRPDRQSKDNWPTSSSRRYRRVSLSQTATSQPIYASWQGRFGCGSVFTSRVSLKASLVLFIFRLMANRQRQRQRFRLKELYYDDYERE